MLISLLIVAAGGALGAVARFATVVFSGQLLGTRFPYGTLLVNSMGSFLAGFLMILIMERFATTDTWRLFLVVGFLGAYTTFSSFTWETWVLYESGEQLRALINVAANIVGSLGAVFLGTHMGRMLGG